jgi:peptidyl-prolyl cis-trans isomerase B (cyclophilin B)
MTERLLTPTLVLFLGKVMNSIFRPTLLFALGAFLLPSCQTVDRGLEATMGVFKPKGDALTDSAEIAPTAGANYDHAVVMLDVNGTPRKVVIELLPKSAPATVANFKKLVNSGFYNDIAIHRVLANYLVQLGDPVTKEEGKRNEWGLSDVGYKLRPEISAPLRKGALAMARSNAAIAAGDKQSSGSQFFILLRSASRLEGEYTVFGQVREGLEVLEAIAGMTVDTNDAPTRRFVVKSIRLVPIDSPELKPDQRTGRKTRTNYEKGSFEKLFDRFW